MRRGIKFSKTAYFFLGFTALFNLFSIILDQLVVQQENKIRNLDQIVNEKRIEVNHFLYTNKVFKEISFKIHFSASNLIEELNYLTRGLNYLNSNISKKINDDDIDKLKNIYELAITNNINKFNESITDLQLIFYNIQEDEIFLKFLEKERPPDTQFHPAYELLRYANRMEKLVSKRKKSLEIAKKYSDVGYDYLKNYNFAARDEYDQQKNYEIYLEIYNDMLLFNRLKNNFDSLSEYFKKEFNTSYSEYYISLDNFAILNDKKNYLILLSILFQIIGLVGLAFLFRVLIVENKWEV